MARSISASAVLRWFGRSADLLKPSERRVLDSAVKGTTIARDVNQDVTAEATFGERLADSIARTGGSWSFILGFMAFLAIWAVLNTIVLSGEAFDPYPFIFLNLLLSMLAALQAPVIMMSQNRAAARDRLDASHDYEINLKAEIEILALHDKIDEMRREDAHRVSESLASIATRLEAIEARLATRAKADNS